MAEIEKKTLGRSEMKKQDVHSLREEQITKESQSSAVFLWIVVLVVMTIIVGVIVYVFYAPIVRTKYDTYKKGEDTKFELGVIAEEIVTEKMELSASDITYGVFVDEVLSDGLAYRAGVMRGDIIVKINSKKVKSVDDINKILKKMKSRNTVNIIVRRRKGNEYVKCELSCKIK